MGIAWDEAIRVFEEETGATVEFEEKAFEQIRQSANMILNTSEAPDIMEYNKGNASAGLLASQGLLTDITAAVEQYGWDDMLSESLQTTVKYDERGVMGSGSWYGVPNYGEFVMVYYNKDLFDEHSVEIPETYEDLVAAMDTFVGAGVTPFAMSGAEYPAGQLFYQLALTEGDRQFVNDYQLYENPVDFSGPALRHGAEEFDAWVKAGYVDDFSAGLTAEDMGTSFIAGDYPMRIRARGGTAGSPTRSRASSGASSRSPALTCTQAPAATSGLCPRRRRTRTWPTSSSTSRCARRSRPLSATTAGCRWQLTRRTSRTRRAPSSFRSSTRSTTSTDSPSTLTGRLRASTTIWPAPSSN
jgi:ABC-type glycerol-3-phosphate transport system substrate-binding protein